METRDVPSTPAEWSQECEVQILKIVAEYFTLPIASIRVRHDGAFLEDDGSMTFIVQHSTGLYAVNAVVNEAGELANITAANLQSDALQ